MKTKELIYVYSQLAAVYVSLSTSEEDYPVLPDVLKAGSWFRQPFYEMRKQQ